MDGPRDIHDKRSPLRTGTGTFDRIMDNLIEIAEKIQNKKEIKIIVRVNIDKENADRVEELLEILAERKLTELLTVIPAQTEAVTSVCQDIADICLSPTEYFKKGSIKVS